MENPELDVINRRTLVEIRDLSVHFKTIEGRVQALDHVNLELKEGEILGIIGESALYTSFFRLNFSFVIRLPSW